MTEERYVTLLKIESFSISILAMTVCLIGHSAPPEGSSISGESASLSPELMDVCFGLLAPKRLTGAAGEGVLSHIETSEALNRMLFSTRTSFTFTPRAVYDCVCSMYEWEPCKSEMF